MKVILGNKEYTYLSAYQKNDAHRAAFNALAKKVFGLSFEDWYQSGYWQEKHIPYTLFDGEKAVANVSVNIMNFYVFGKQQRYIQLGTIMTDEDYRNKNLSRFLIEKVLEEWNPKCDLIYLHANNTVLEFYTRFGFRRVNEYSYFKRVDNDSEGHAFEKLDMSLPSNRNMLHDYAKNSRFFGKLSLHENADLVMFYCTGFMKENVYYIKALDVILVATFEDHQLHILDIFSKVSIELDKVVSCAGKRINKVLLGFTPEDCTSYEVSLISGDDVLFIQDGKTAIFDENKIMLPLLSHA